MRRQQNPFKFEGVNFDGIIFSEKMYNILLRPSTQVGRNLFINTDRIFILNEGEKLSNQKIESGSSDKGPITIGNFIQRVDDKSPKTFIVGTGRSGTGSIAKILNQNKSIMAYHEPVQELIPLTYEYMTMKRGSKSVHNIFKCILDSLNDYGRSLVVSDQKLAPYLDLLKNTYPQAKFIWLIRNPMDFVNSAYNRGWFTNKEFGYRPKNGEPEVYSSKIYSKYRLNGYLCGEFSETEWIEMSSFERNCWYWKFWNSMIEKQLQEIHADKWKIINIDNLSSKLDEIGTFIDGYVYKYQIVKTNVAKYEKSNSKHWSDDKKELLDKWCTEYYQDIIKRYNL